MKMKIVLQNQTYNNIKTFTRYIDKSKVASKQKKTDSEIQTLANIETKNIKQLNKQIYK